MILRYQQASDVGFLVDLWADPEVTRYLGGPRERDWLRSVFEETAQDPYAEQYDLWPVIEKETGRVVGQCGLLEKEVAGRTEIELTYVLASSAWGKGYATEMAQALKRHAFEEMGIGRLIALIEPGNAASERVAIRIGMRLENEVIRPGGAVRKVYAVEREDSGQAIIEGGVRMEKNGALVSILIDQWTRVWDMWEEMIRTIPDDEWRKGDVDYLIPVRHLVHVLVCDDAFSEDIPLDQHDGFKLFEVREWGTPVDELPTREVALSKLAEVRTTVGERLTKLDDAALLQPEEVHPWAGETRMGKLLYVLRHSQHHLGEVNAELTRRGIKAAIWEKEKAARLGLSPWW